MSTKTETSYKAFAFGILGLIVTLIVIILTQKP